MYRYTVMLYWTILNRDIYVHLIDLNNLHNLCLRGFSFLSFFLSFFLAYIAVNS
jgi:hypothetical protein